MGCLPVTLDLPQCNTPQPPAGCPPWTPPRTIPTPACFPSTRTWSANTMAWAPATRRIRRPIASPSAFGPAELSQALRERRAGGPSQPLSLYVHLPFCNTICFYCACNKVVTKDRSRSAKYLRYLGREIRALAAQVDRSSPVRQLHWGGGTPTFLSPDELVAARKDAARPFRVRSRRRMLDRDRSAQGRSRYGGAARRSRLQPDERRRAGFRPRRAEGGESHPGRGRDARGPRRRPRAGFPLAQRRPDLRPAAPDDGGLRCDARQGDRCDARTASPSTATRTCRTCSSRNGASPSRSCRRPRPSSRFSSSRSTA